MKTGIVLEGGAIRTMFSSGVCDGLLTRGLLPDYVIGVSAGIAYGVSYVSRQEGRNMEIMERYINERRYMGLGNLLRRNNRAYFGLDFVYDRVPNQLVPFDYDAFAAYPGEVEAVVTDLATGLPRYVPVEPPGQDLPDPAGHLRHAPALPHLHRGGRPLFRRRRRRRHPL